MKKIIFSDYDKTLYLNDDDMKLNISALNDFIKKGNLFTVATGRSLQNFKGKIEKYNIPLNYIILNHGAVIVDSKFKVIKSEIIDKNDLLNVLDFIKNRFNIIDLILYGVLENDKTINDDIVKITIRFETRKEAEVAYVEFQKLYYKIFNIYLINSASNRIEFISKKANKSIAIRKIIEIENIENSNVYTIGDSSNDLEMLKDYNGYAMKDSEECIRKIALKQYSSVSLLIEDAINGKI